MALFFFLGLALVFGLAAGCQVVAGGLLGEAVVVSESGRQCFGVGQPGAGEQPGGVVMVGAPGGGGAFDVVGGDQVLALFAQPTGEVGPLAQQAFQGDFDHHVGAALVLDQQPFFDELRDQGPARFG